MSYLAMCLVWTVAGLLAGAVLGTEYRSLR